MVDESCLLYFIVFVGNTSTQLASPNKKTGFFKTSLTVLIELLAKTAPRDDFVEYLLISLSIKILVNYLFTSFIPSSV